MLQYNTIPSFWPYGFLPGILPQNLGRPSVEDGAIPTITKELRASARSDQGRRPKRLAAVSAAMSAIQPEPDWAVSFLMLAVRQTGCVCQTQVPFSPFHPSLPQNPPYSILPTFINNSISPHGDNLDLPLASGFQ